jgi:hypothetical protein
MTPVTDSIMASLPPAKAGVGSAMNDTTRQTGGALGVAILGTVLSAVYHAAMADGVAGLPAHAAAAARDSVGSALTVAARLGDQPGQLLAAAARAAFVHAMTVTVLVAAGVALAGVLVALRFLPHHPATEPATASPAPTATPQQASHQEPVALALRVQHRATGRPHIRPRPPETPQFSTDPHLPAKVADAAGLLRGVPASDPSDSDEAADCHAAHTDHACPPEPRQWR